ncbi:MAG: alanine/glycine:cation symporter family protein [Pseudomonadota bacterium]
MTEENRASLADQINDAITPLSDFVNSIIFFSVPVFGVSVPIVVIWLLVAALILTFALSFINLRGFGHAVALVTGKTGDSQSASHGQISHFQALTSALSGTVGLGNIASVPIAIALGGPGAVVWMILAGFFGMSSKFAECALAVKYRQNHADGTVSGGPMYYIEAVFKRRGLALVGKVLAIFFAVMTMGASVSIFQVNQAHAQFSSVTGISAPLLFGGVMATGVAIVILGGIRVIGRVTSILVPGMGILYLGAGLIILAANAPAIPGAIGLIVGGAFGLDAAGGGIIGALINGIKRATYSSEAGVGSAAIAHAAVRTKTPLTEGYVALLEPFIDTIVVCTVTALVIVVTGVYVPYVGVDNPPGITMTSAAFGSMFSWYPYILLVSVVLFAFSTLVTWAYYGSQAAAYIFGRKRYVDVTFKLALSLLLSIGAAVQLSAIVDFIDAMLFGMCIPNIIALYLLLPELRRDVRAYEAGRAARTT